MYQYHKALYRQQNEDVPISWQVKYLQEVIVEYMYDEKRMPVLIIMRYIHLTFAYVANRVW